MRKSPAARGREGGRKFSSAVCYCGGVPPPLVPPEAAPDVPPVVAAPEAGGVAAVVEPLLIAPLAGAAEASGVVLAVDEAGAAEDEASAAPASAFFFAQAPRARRLTLASANAVFVTVVMMQSLKEGVGAPVELSTASLVPDHGPVSGSDPRDTAAKNREVASNAPRC